MGLGSTGQRSRAACSNEGWLLWLLCLLDNQHVCSKMDDDMVHVGQLLAVKETEDGELGHEAETALGRVAGAAPKIRLPFLLPLIATASDVDWSTQHNAPIPPLLTTQLETEDILHFPSFGCKK